MSIVSTTLDVIGALSAALGGIGLMNEIYRRVAFRVVDGQVVAYDPVLDSEDKPTRGSRARLAYDAGEGVVEHVSNSTSYPEDVAKHPVGSAAKVRFLPSSRDVPEFAPDLKESFAFPVGALAFAIVAFVAATFIR